MKHKSVKRISPSSIAVATFGLYDDCNNGYDNFNVNVEVWATNGDRHYGSNETFENKNYYFVEGGYYKELIAEHFPDLLPVNILSGCDSFGFPCYPVMNFIYHLKNKDFDYVQEKLRLSKAEMKDLDKFNEIAFINFLFSKQPQYKKEVRSALAAIDKRSGSKTVIKEKISPYMYNDINYKLVTESNGWNVYKKNKPTSYVQVKGIIY